MSRSATRALDVLELLGEIREPIRALIVRERLGLSHSTTDQLLKTMVDSGHLVFDSTGKTYRPSPRLVGFSNWLIETYGADDSLRTLIRSLQQATNMTITLSAPNDLFMQVVDFAAPAQWDGERGLRVSMFGSAIGSAHLSTLDRDDLGRLIRRARLDAVQTAAIHEVLAQIRSDGFSDGLSGVIWSIAIPLKMFDRGTPFVLALTGDEREFASRREELRMAIAVAIAAWRRTSEVVVSDWIPTG